jgi:hypothetical protein
MNCPGWVYHLATLFTWLFPLYFFILGYMKDLIYCMCHHWYHFIRTCWDYILLILLNCFIVCLLIYTKVTYGRATEIMHFGNTVLID